MKFKILLILTSLFALSCSSSDVIDLTNYKNEAIIFGSGGGFSGIENRFCLLENGVMYELKNMESKGIVLGKIDKNTAKQLFSNTNRIINQIPEINNPGNVYQLFEFQKNEDKKTYIWSNASDQYQEIIILHSILMKYQNELSTSKSKQ